MVYNPQQWIGNAYNISDFIVWDIEPNLENQRICFPVGSKTDFLSVYDYRPTVLEALVQNYNLEEASRTHGRVLVRKNLDTLRPFLEINPPDGGEWNEIRLLSITKYNLTEYVNFQLIPENKPWIWKTEATLNGNKLVYLVAITSRSKRVLIKSAKIHVTIGTAIDIKYF